MTRTRAFRGFRLGLFVACGTSAVAASARAQQPAPPPGVFTLAPQETLKGIKHHASFMLSGGFDLDVFGNAIMAGVGQRGDAPMAVRAGRTWPDIYVTVPKRPELVVGFGVFQKDEVVGRLSRATYTSDPLTDAGNIAGPGDLAGTLTLDVSTYRERSWELGWRHYMVMTRRAKQYANIMYGIRTVEPIAGTFSISETGFDLGTLRLYDRSRLKTFSLEIGLTFEVARAGLFAQVGARWQQKLKRYEDDLAAWGLETVNDTGVRFYMPLQFGVLFRL